MMAEVQLPKELLAGAKLLNELNAGAKLPKELLNGLGTLLATDLRIDVELLKGGWTLAVG